MSRHPAKRNDGVFPLLLWRSPPPKNKKRQNSACNNGTILAFSENQRQSTFCARRKAPFLPPKTARTAGRSGRAGAEKRQAFSPALPLAAPPSAASRPQAVSICACRSRKAPAHRRNVRFCGFRRVLARLCQESRTKRRHGRDGVERAAGHSCISCICSDSDIFGCGSVVIAYH